jgi:hypothetical protein
VQVGMGRPTGRSLLEGARAEVEGLPERHVVSFPVIVDRRAEKSCNICPVGQIEGKAKGRERERGVLDGTLSVN